MLQCCESNHDGKIDYIGFTDQFHEPAKEIGFNLAVLLTNLSEHMPNEPRYSFLEHLWCHISCKLLKIVLVFRGSNYYSTEYILFCFRLTRFLETASSVLNYFQPFLGRIEILGGSKRIERVYFEIKESNIEQWLKPQIRVRTWLLITETFLRAYKNFF